MKYPYRVIYNGELVEPNTELVSPKESKIKKVRGAEEEVKNDKRRNKRT